MKVKISLIDNDYLKHLLRGKEIKSNNVGFIAKRNNSIVGFSMLEIIDDTAYIKVLFVYNDFRRCGIGKQFISKIIEYSDEKKIKLFAKFKTVNFENDNIKKFYTSQGFHNINLDDIEYNIDVSDWRSIFNFQYDKTTKLSYKKISELNTKNKRRIESICSIDLNNNTYLHPINDNKHAEASLFIIGEQDNLLGWCVAQIISGVLKMDSIYIVPEYRHLGLWVNILQYMSSDSYVQSMKHKFSTINYHVGSDNIIMLKFMNVLLKGVKHNKTHSYTVNLKLDK